MGVNRQKSSRLTGTLQFGFILAVFFSVVHHGSVHAPILASVTIWLGLISIFAATKPIRTELVPILGLAVCLVGFLVLASFLQTLSLGASHRSWVDAAAFGFHVSGSISVAPAATISATLWLAAPLFSFVLSILLFQDEGQARMLVVSLAVIGFWFAVFGLWEYFASPTTLLFQERLYPMDGVSGTFVNRNTAATFLGITSVLWAAIFLNYFKKIRLVGLKRFLLSSDNSKSRDLVVASVILAALAIVLSALFLTKSRAGIMSALIGLSLVLILNRSTTDRGGPIVSRLLSAALISIFVLGSVFWLYGSAVLGRISELNALGDARWCFFKSVLNGALQYPIAGSGFGTLQLSFPAYREAACFGLSYVLDKAHNGYLDVFMGLGMLGLLALLLGIGVLAIVLIQGVQKRRRFRTEAVAALAVLLVCCMNSILDFSLQIPGVAVFSAAILGAGSVVSSLGMPKSTVRGSLAINRNILDS